MSLKLGKSFNRSFSLRIPILDGFYNIGIFFDKKSTFLLFRLDPDFSNSSFKHNVKINMFKNLESSKFCETFIKLHNYRKNTLDISNQFEKIKDEYTHDVSFILNETITLSKFELHDKNVFDTLNIYGFTLNTFIDEFIFILTERHSIMRRLNKKIVRTSGVQIATTPALNILDEFNQESKIKIQSGRETVGNKDTIIKFSEAEREATED
ncbi:MAG: hypothetical protein ACFFG0_01320 [Candidatus Thorarchaeota archaeon]